jgi:hypothetical protein
MMPNTPLNQDRLPAPLDLGEDDAPPTPEERAAAARLGDALDALSHGRAGIDSLPPASDDDLHALAALGLLLQSTEGGADLSPGRQDALWQRITQRLQGNALRTPERPMTWWRWLVVAVPSFAALALLVFISIPDANAPSPTAPTAPTSAAAAATHLAPTLPHAVAALDADAARLASDLQSGKIPTPDGDTALRDHRRARLHAWQADLVRAHRAGLSAPSETP